VSHYILPLAAGGFLYIALADLIPELNANGVSVKRSLFQVLFMILGLALMWLLLDFHFLQH
jgi:zinc transporter ZupT